MSQLVLRIALLTQGGEKHETDKEPGNALAEHLAHPEWAYRIAQFQLSGSTLDHGDPRHCCRYFNPARSVSIAFGVLHHSYVPVLLIRSEACQA